MLAIRTMPIVQILNKGSYDPFVDSYELVSEEEEEDHEEFSCKKSSYSKVRTRWSIANPLWGHCKTHQVHHVTKKGAKL
jgi:hypothetical protein